MNFIPTKKPVILIAEDDSVSAGLLSQLMKDQGYEVLVVSDGAQALRTVLNKKPDLVILDNYLPSMTGREICREIKYNPSTRLIPVVIITGFIESIEKIRVIEAGADDFIHKPFNPVELATRVKSLLHAKLLNDELDSVESVLFTLARAIEAKDVYTQGHTERVSSLALLVGHQLKLTEDDKRALYKGGIIHDIGKIAIPDAILNKPGHLDDAEYAKIRTHPERGAEICQGLKSIQAAIPIVRHHHEKFDGSGYPDKLSGEKIPLVARIMSIVDVYDALTTKRSYKDPLTQDKAFEIMAREADMGWWDKKILTEVRRIIFRSA